MILAVVVACGFAAGWAMVRAWQRWWWRPSTGDFDARHGEFLRALAEADKRGPP